MKSSFHCTQGYSHKILSTKNNIFKIITSGLQKKMFYYLRIAKEDIILINIGAFPSRTFK